MERKKVGKNQLVDKGKDLKAAGNHAQNIYQVKYMKSCKVRKRF